MGNPQLVIQGDYYILNHFHWMNHIHEYNHSAQRECEYISAKEWEKRFIEEWVKKNFTAEQFHNFSRENIWWDWAEPKPIE